MTAYSREIAEQVLAHTLSDKTEAAYRRSDLFVKRAGLMTAWAKYIDRSPATANVVGIRKPVASGERVPLDPATPSTTVR